MLSARWAAVAIKIGHSARIGQTLQLASFRITRHLEVGISIPPWLVIVFAEIIQASSEPILEMKFFVVLVCALDEDIGSDR